MSKINLNFTIPNIKSGIPLRIWDVLGCGGLSSDELPGRDSVLFQGGEDLVCFDGLEDLCEKWGTIWNTRRSVSGLHGTGTTRCGRSTLI